MVSGRKGAGTIVGLVWMSGSIGLLGFYTIFGELIGDTACTGIFS